MTVWVWISSVSSGPQILPYMFIEQSEG
jgi:hypothetical protein